MDLSKEKFLLGRKFVDVDELQCNTKEVHALFTPEKPKRLHL